MLLSIVVPIYNADKHLEKCLESIINQTYKELQIILVNDGSIDTSSNICEKYAKKDSRIEVINKVNEGVVKARKAGVNRARGDFIGYVDADDYIELDYFEKMVLAKEESDVDIIVSNHYHDIGEDSVIVKNSFTEGIYETKDILEKLIYSGNFFEYGITPHLYTKIFKADLLKKIQNNVPDNIVAGDDAAVIYPYICQTKKICITDITGYHYVQHMDTITKREYSNEELRVDSLISYLRSTMKKLNMSKCFEKQLQVYRNYLLALRKINVFDIEQGSILKPFGGLNVNDKIVIYGAGVLGQKIYTYLNRINNIEVVGWLDKNFKIYQKNDMPVYNPEEFLMSDIKYDYILIANITEKTAMSIKDYLLNMEVVYEKIKWFTKDFRGIDD